MQKGIKTRKKVNLQVNINFSTTSSSVNALDCVHPT